jgi:MoaA/NifB/PqqE/SkfB family radical SAM enzyme
MQVQNLLLDFGNACNNRCVFCRAHVNRKQTLRLDDIVDFGGLISVAERVDVTGTGEFTVHPDFREIIGRLSAANKPFRLVTNGTTLDESLEEVLLASSLYELVVSINSLDRATYVRLCGTNSLPKVLDSFIRIANNPLRKFSLYASFVLTAYNFGELEEFVRFAHRNNARLGVMDLTPTIKDYAEGLLIADTPENMEAVEKARRLAIELGVPASLPRLQYRTGPTKGPDPELLKTCKWPFESIAVQPNGDVLPCCWCRTVMGNIREQSMEDIWEGPIYEDLRDCLKRGDPKHCMNCRGFG